MGYNNMKHYMEKLELIKKDDKQFEAYKSEDSSVVIAGPGSGKTTVLTLKMVNLLLGKIKEPRGLACITFSKEAARDVRERLYQLGYNDRKNVFLGTVHSFCMSEILYNFAHLYDYKIPLPIKIISQKEKRNLFNQVVNDLKLGYTDVKILEMDRERTLNIGRLSKVQVPSYDVALRVAQEYEEKLYKLGLMDYESIIKFSTILIQEQEYVRKCLNAKFPWILVDEYQDLGKPLHEMVLSLFTSTDIKIFAVGDPDQSIYGFSGAIPDYLLEFYERLDIIPIELKNNYRSNQDIVDSSELILNERRNYTAITRKGEKAEFIFITCEEDLEEQYDCCINEIIPHCRENNIPLEEIAILVKGNREVKDISMKLKDAGIPYYISKHDYERTDFVKWLELCASWVNDKISTSYDELYNYWENINIIHENKKFLSNDNRIILKRELYDNLISSYKYNDNIRKWLEYLVCKLDVESLLDNSSVFPDEIENLEKLLRASSEEGYKNYNLSEFSKLGKPEKQITITTRHSSKGLEFEVIVMLGMEEGNFPDFRSADNKIKLAEERRTCFVCVSRAKKTCILIRSKVHNIPTRRGNWRKESPPSRYWVELYKKHNDF